MSLPCFRSAILASLLVAAGGAQAASQDFHWMVRGGFSQIVPTPDSGHITPGKVDIDNDIGPTFNIAYFITPHWAVDLLGGLPFKHDIRLNGGKVGSTKQLPPIVTFQYHFFPYASVRPFVGIGVNYTHFFEEKLDGGGDLHLSDSWGLAYQAGFDVALGEHWSIGTDVRYARIDSDVKINGNKVGKVDVDPMVYSLNVGFRF